MVRIRDDPRTKFRPGRDLERLTGGGGEWGEGGRKWAGGWMGGGGEKTGRETPQNVRPTEARAHFLHGVEARAPIGEDPRIGRPTEARAQFLHGVEATTPKSDCSQEEEKEEEGGEGGDRG